MHYTSDQAFLLQQVFRHKIVHLAQPNPVTLIRRDNSHIIWTEYNFSNRQKHLSVEPNSQFISWAPNKPKITATHIFHLSITDFKDDIKDSVLNPLGYLVELERVPDLQDKFDDAIREIFLVS